MTQAAYEALQPTFAALSEVKAPTMPVSEALAEASALLAFLNDDARSGTDKPGAAVQTKLIAVGLPAGHIAAFGQSVDALRYAQALHQSKSLRVVDSDRQQLIANAYTLRADIIAACRWNMRADRIAQGTLNQIAEGEGVQDLIADLGALAALIQSHPDAFALDTTFDPDARAEACRHAAAQTQALTSSNATSEDKQDAHNNRDRAWTHFHALQKQLYDAAKYALRSDPQTLARFISSYNQKRHKRAMARAQAKPTP